MIKAIIFDLDGVIVDTAHYHYLAWKRLAIELGFDLTLDQNELLKGVSRMRSLEIILDLGGIKLSAPEMERIAKRERCCLGQDEGRVGKGGLRVKECLGQGGLPVQVVEATALLTM